jgi:hypothetical protein
MIGVISTDISEENGLPPGTMFQNIRYCRDRPVCEDAAKTFRFVRPEARR